MIKGIFYGVLAAGVISCATVRESNPILKFEGHKMFLDAYVFGRAYGAVPDYTHSSNYAEIVKAIREGPYLFMDGHFVEIAPGVGFSADEAIALTRAEERCKGKPIDRKTLELVIDEMSKQALEGDISVGVLSRYELYKLK